MKPTGQDRGRAKGMDGERKGFRKDGNAPFKRPAKEEENPGPKVRVWRDKPLEVRADERAGGDQQRGPRRDWGPPAGGREGGNAPRGAKFGQRGGDGPPREGRFDRGSGPRRDWGPPQGGREGGDAPRGGKFGPKFGPRGGDGPPRAGRFERDSAPRRDWGPPQGGREGGDAPRGGKFGTKFGPRGGDGPPRAGRFERDSAPRREWTPPQGGREGGDAPRGSKFGPRGSEEKPRASRVEAKGGLRGGNVPLRAKPQAEAAPREEPTEVKRAWREGGEDRPRREAFSPKGPSTGTRAGRFESKRDWAPARGGRDDGEAPRGRGGDRKFGPKFGSREGGPPARSGRGDRDRPSAGRFEENRPRNEGFDAKAPREGGSDRKFGPRTGGAPARRDDGKPRESRFGTKSGPKKEWTPVRGSDEAPRAKKFAAKSAAPRKASAPVREERVEAKPKVFSKRGGEALRSDPKVEAKGGQKTLERVLSKAGMGSRTEARSWVHAGRVKVNGKAVENPDMWIDFDRDKIEFDGEPLTAKDKLYILLYKPAGYVSTYKDPEGRKTVYDLLGDVPSFVGTVGRLDEDSSGLLILSNDNQFAERLTNPDYHVPKTYLVKCSSLISDETIEALRKGVELNDGQTKPAEVSRVRDQGTKTFLEITLREGRNRQVRRMVEAVGSKVLKLVRTRIGSVEIGDLASGKWRKLAGPEIAALNPKRGRA